MRTTTTVFWALHRVENRRFGSLGLGVSTPPDKQNDGGHQCTATSTAGSHNGEHEEIATPLVHYTHSTLPTHYTSHTHYIPEVQAPPRPAGRSTNMPEGQPAGSRRPRSPDTHDPTRRTRARPCGHKTDSKQCQDVSMGQHSDSTNAQRHDESPCALSQGVNRPLTVSPRRGRRQINCR